MAHKKGAKLRVPPRGQMRIQATRPDFAGAYKLTVPPSIARMVGPDALFQVELTEEGLLYRHLNGAEGVTLPRWLRSD